MILSCIGSAVNSRAEQLILIRPAAGAYDENGRWIELEPESIPVSGTVQPMRAEEISRLEDSRHIIEAIKIYTISDIRNLSLDKQTQPDSLIRKAQKYEVYSFADWDSYFKIIAVRKE